MGGNGSGRYWYWGAKSTVESYCKLDIRELNKRQLLEPNQTFNWSWSRNGEKISDIKIQTYPKKVILIYRHKAHSEEWEDFNYPVFLDWTNCHLGGERPWFLCPAVGCHKRVAILYSSRVFACRSCLHLVYSSQREEDYDRYARKANKIRERLGWQPGIYNLRGDEKPKGMHWKTFQRLLNEHDALENRSMMGVAHKFKLLGESMDDWF